MLSINVVEVDEVGEKKRRVRCDISPATSDVLLTMINRANHNINYKLPRCRAFSFSVMDDTSKQK